MNQGKIDIDVIALNKGIDYNRLLEYFGAIVISAVIYFAYRFYRSRQGINTDLTYKEIPTE